MADLNNQLLQRIANSLDQLVDAGGGSVSTGSAATEMDETARKAANSIEKVTREVNRNLTSLARQIPLIGDALADSISKAVDKGVSAILGRTGTGAGVKGLFGAITVTAAAVANEFTKISKAQAELARQTGFFGDKLTNIRTTTTAVYRDNLKYGLSMSDVASSAAALTTSLGTVNRVTTGLVQTNAQLAKFAGSTAESMSGLTSTLVRGFNMTNTEVDKFTNLIAGKAVAAGMNASLLIRDMATNSNLVSMHTQRGAEYLSQMAKYSGATGIGFEKMQGMSDIFLNMETGAEMAQKINMYTGGMLNSQLLFNKALKGDTLGIFKEITNAFRSPKGIQMINEFPGAVRKLSNELGLSFNELRKMATMSNEQLRTFEAEKAANDAIQQSLLAQQTTLQRIGNQIKQVVLPTVTKIAEIGFNITKGIFGADGQITGSAVMGGLTALTAIGGLAAVFAKGATPMNPTYVKIVGGGGFGGAPYLPRDGGGGGGSRGMGNFARKALGVAKVLPFIGSIFTFYEAYQLYQSGNTAGAIASGLLGILGLIPGAGAVGKGVFKGARALIGKAAMGSVVSSPSLFMVGEENRREVIVPTERIRQGLPVSPDVAAELGSIGVPGYARGGYVTSSAMRSQFATEQGRGVIASSGSLAETRRRQQEMRAVDAEYKRMINMQHEEVTDLMREQMVNDRRNASLLMGSLERNSMSGGRFLTTTIKSILQDFKNSAINGVKQGYQIWKQGLDETKRVWVNAAEDTYDFINIFRDKGSRSAFTELKRNRGMQTSMDNLTGLLVGSGEGKYVGDALRTSLYASQLGGMHWTRSASLGLGQYATGASMRMNDGTFNLTGSPLLGFIGNQYSRYQNYSARRTREKAYSSTNYGLSNPQNNEILDYSELYRPDPLDMGGYLNPDYVPPGYGGFGRNQRNQFESRVGSSYGRYQTGERLGSTIDPFRIRNKDGSFKTDPLYTGNRYGMSDFGTGFGIDRVRGNLGPRNITARSESLLESEDLPKLSISDLDDGYMYVEGSDPMDPNFGTRTDVKPPPGPSFQERTGLNVGAMGAAAVGGALTAFGQQGFNRQGVRSALGQGLGGAAQVATAAAFKTGHPAAIAAAVGLTLASFVLPSVVPKGKSEARYSAFSQLQKKVMGERDIGTFTKSDDLKKAMKGKSSQTRTLSGLMSMFAASNLSLTEAMNLASFLTIPPAQRVAHPDRFYWNQRLFNVTPEEMEEKEFGSETLAAYKSVYGDKDFKEIQQDKQAMDARSRKRFGNEKSIAEEFVRRANIEINRATGGTGEQLKVEDYMENGSVNMNKLRADAAARGMDLQSHIFNTKPDEGGASGGTGPGGPTTLSMPPELQETLRQINMGIQEMTKQQTIQVFISGEKMLEQIVNQGGN